MSLEFQIAFVTFHVSLLLGCALFARAWWAAAPAEGATRWALRLGASFLGLLLGALLLAVALMSAFERRPFFGVARLLSQAIFGEGVLLLGGLALLHARRGRRRRSALLAAATAGLLAVYAEAYHHGPHALAVREHDLDLSQGAAGARTLRLLHLSDIQTNAVGAYEEAVLRRARELQPDLVVLTGDYVQDRTLPIRRGSARDFNALLRRLRLQAPLGVYAVRGDVEGSGWRSLFEGTGIECLGDEVKRIALPGGRGLSLVGLSAGLSRAHSAGELQAVSAGPDEADLRVVMGHAPDFVQALPGWRRVDLALAGHTHGGQVVLPFYGAPVILSRLPRRFAGGLEAWEGIPLHVSRGIGLERGVAPQVRFLCPPEMCVLKVRYAVASPHGLLARN